MTFDLLVLTVIASVVDVVGYFGKKVILGVRPENRTIERPCNCPADKGYKTVVQVYELLGSDALIHFNIGEKNVMAKIDARIMMQRGEDALFHFDIDHIYYFDKDTEVSIYA